MAFKEPHNSRQHFRTAATLVVEVYHEELGSFKLKTRDLSNGGIFVIVDDEHGLKIGHKLTVKVKSKLGKNVEPPTLKMEVVRSEPAGLGLKFID